MVHTILKRSTQESEGLDLYKSIARLLLIEWRLEGEMKSRPFNVNVVIVLESTSFSYSIVNHKS